MFSCKYVSQVLEHRYRSVRLRKSLVPLGRLAFRAQCLSNSGIVYLLAEREYMRNLDAFYRSFCSHSEVGTTSGHLMAQLLEAILGVCRLYEFQVKLGVLRNYRSHWIQHRPAILVNLRSKHFELGVLQ